ncbi:DoxX family protein [Nocardia sp. NPDC059240]|uniref:DoxX family protein n=1 Tax=Nocardia sp. NPDC059240 TaxID=3346786 RepID=UPI00367717B0
MKVVSTVLAGALTAEFLAFGAAKLFAIAPMRERAEHLDYTTTAYRGIGAVEIVAAGGVLAGLAFPSIGMAAGTGLTLLMGGAVASHVRNGDGVQLFAPAVGSGLASLAYTLVLAGVSR